MPTNPGIEGGAPEGAPKDAPGPAALRPGLIAAAAGLAFLAAGLIYCAREGGCLSTVAAPGPDLVRPAPEGSAPDAGTARFVLFL